MAEREDDRQQAERRDLMKIFRVFMGCVGLFLTMGYIDDGRYVLAVIAAICAGVQFWGATSKED